VIDERVPLSAVGRLDDPGFAEEIAPMEVPATWTYQSDVVIAADGGATLCAAAPSSATERACSSSRGKPWQGPQSARRGRRFVRYRRDQTESGSTPSARLHFAIPMQSRATGRWTPACSPR
jgi:hypothetical protein